MENPPHSPMIRRVVASLLWQGSASLVGHAISWLSTLLVIRLLSPDDYGLMAMAGISIGFIILIGDLGIGSVIVQAPALKAVPLGATLLMSAGVVGARVLVAGALPQVAMLAGLLGATIYSLLMVAFKPQTLRSLWVVGVGR